MTAWMLFDRAKLGYERRGARVFVMYPKPHPTEKDVVLYEGGFPVEFPAWYFTAPPNAITAERVAIFMELMHD